MLLRYIEKPESYFKLKISSGFLENFDPKILPHWGRIYKGKQWEKIGLIPYSQVVLKDGEEQKKIGHYYEKDGQSYSFEHHVRDDFDDYEDLLKDPLFNQERIEIEEWDAAIKSGKRHIDTYHDALSLSKVGIGYEEISNITEFTKLFVDGILLEDQGNIEDAIILFDKAIEIEPENVRCLEHIQKCRALVGDTKVIDEGLSYYVNDMDSAVHAGDAESWLKLAMNRAQDFHLALDIVLKILEGLDVLIKNKIDKNKRIYGFQKKSYYQYKKAGFIKRLGTLKGFFSKELILANLDRPDIVEDLISKILVENPNKQKKSETLLALLKDSS